MAQLALHTSFLSVSIFIRSALINIKHTILLLTFLIPAYMPSRLKKLVAHRYYERALKLDDEDESHEILPLLMQAARLNPHKCVYWETLFNVATCEERYGLALKCINKLSKFEKYASISISFLKAEMLFKLGHYRKALRNLTLLNCCPSLTPELSFLKAKCLLHLGKHRKALKILTRVPQNHQAFPSCQFFKGICYFYLQEYRVAIQYFNDAAYHKQLRFNPDLLLFKGNCHYNLEEFERAVINYEELLAIDPSYSEIKFSIDLARYRLFTKD